VSKETNQSEARREDPLVLAVRLVAGEIHELHKSVQNNQVILDRIAKMENKIMSKISEYADKVEVSFDAIAASVDEIVASQTGITGDVAELKRLIAELQASPGAITPEDQALLDALTVKIDSLVSKTAATATALKELDAQTADVPPAPPV
jgi:phage shock protein A